jgi:hypothetical protein
MFGPRSTLGRLFQEFTMTNPLFEAGCTLAVLLGLYGFLCHWEAARADLVANARRHQSGAVDREPHSYRTRARVAFAACGAIAAGLIATAL